MIGVCVKANRWFTFGKDYEIIFHSDRATTVESDDGCYWFVSYHGDGYYRSTDYRGEEAVFLDRAYCGPEYPYLREDKE